MRWHIGARTLRYMSGFHGAATVLSLWEHLSLTAGWLEHDPEVLVRSTRSESRWRFGASTNRCRAPERSRLGYRRDRTTPRRRQGYEALRPRPESGRTICPVGLRSRRSVTMGGPQSGYLDGGVHGALFVVFATPLAPQQMPARLSTPKGGGRLSDIMNWARAPSKQHRVSSNSAPRYGLSITPPLRPIANQREAVNSPPTARSVAVRKASRNR